MKDVALTFDYELFFKRSGTMEKCILEPTRNIIDAFCGKKISATFFIDVLYYLRMLENKSTKDRAILIREQLQELVAKGHRIELHLHPHWLDAKYDNGSWDFPTYRYYCLQNLEQEKIVDLFVSGTACLNEIARSVDKGYEVIAFRAGGWCICPFDKIKPGFVAGGIKIDSSIMAGIKAKTKEFIYNFDFTEAPELDFYRFSEDPMKINSSGQFAEIPITTYKLNIIDKFIRKMLRHIDRDKYAIYGNGEPVDLIMKSSDHLPLVYTEAFTTDGIDPILIGKKVSTSDLPLITFISHTKNMSPVFYDCINIMEKIGANILNIKQAYEKKLNDAKEGRAGGVDVGH